MPVSSTRPRAEGSVIDLPVTSDDVRPTPTRTIEGCRPPSAARATSATARSPRPSSWPSSWAGRCCSRARPASARPRWPRSWRRSLGTRAHPPPVLRGPGRQHGRLRVELPAPDARDPAARGARAGRRPGHRARHLRRRLPDQAAAAAGARGARRHAAGAADRRDRPGRRGVRGVPAGDPLRLPGHGARDRHHPRPSSRRAWSSPPTARARSTTRSSGAASTTGSTTRRREKEYEIVAARLPGVPERLGPAGGRRSCSGCARRT